MTPTSNALLEANIGSIYDYAAEADVVIIPAEPASANASADKNNRVYNPAMEMACDHHVETFITCIKTAKANSSPKFRSFSAIKATALADPELLKLMTKVLVSYQSLYADINPEHPASISRAQFNTNYHKLFKVGSPDELFDILDQDRDNSIDYLDWCHGVQVQNIETLIASKLHKNELLHMTFNTLEKEMFCKMMKRLECIIELAQSNDVRIFIDAEQTYFQPAIDYLANRMMAKYNAKGSKYPVIFGTYQMYLKDSTPRLKQDIARAEKFNYAFAAKLVRGAYMVSEAEYLKSQGLDMAHYPIHRTIEDTHANYNGGVSFIIEKIAAKQKIPGSIPLEVMFASHNRYTMEHATSEVKRHQLGSDCGVYFGQLLGMADYLTYNLGKNGFRPYKYVPFGKVREVMPYLIRRAIENGDALGGAMLEIEQAKWELNRRKK